MDAWMHRWMDGEMMETTWGWWDGWMDVEMDACMDAWMDDGWMGR